MRTMGDISFKGKMLLYAGATTGTALIVCVLSVMASEWIEWRERAPRDLAIQADVIGMTVTAALAFDDRTAAAETLAGLSANANAVLACIRSRDGTEFARYVRPGSDSVREANVENGEHRFSGQLLHLRRPIVLDGEEIGSIYLQYDLREHYADFAQQAVVVLAAMLLALLGAYVIASKVQSALLRPIEELGRAAKAISENKDYSVRAVKRTNDEFGTLTDAFNEMLAQIQRRDSELQDAHDQLERRVEERTATLAQRERQQAAVARLGQMALSGEELTRLYDRAVGLVAETLEVEYTKVLKLLEDGKTLLILAGVGWREGLVGQGTIGADSVSQAGYTLLAGEPVIVKDLRSEKRFSGPQMLVDHDVISGMSVVIAGKDRPFGVLGAHTTQRREFARDDVHFLQAVANVLSEAIQRRSAEDGMSTLSVAVEQSPATVVITDINGTIQYVNPKFCETTGYTAEEAVGENPRILKSGDMSPDAYKQLWEIICAGDTWRGEFHNKRKNGEFYWEAASISPIRDSEGAITHFLAVKEDITDRKRAEEELRQAKEAADAANGAKSEFLANMSHEIRTPMTAILGFADVLLEQGDLDRAPPERIEAADTIKRNGEYLVQIINDILDLSKIEAGRTVIERIVCSPFTITSEVASLMRVRADAKALPMGVEYLGAVPETILTDPTRLRQILVNLIGNAIKFTDVGGVRLVVRYVTEGPQAFFQFDVIDTGVGMTEEQAAALFEPFTQADASTTRKFGGTGLGLSISRRLARLLGGDIEVVETQAGVGTRFRATIAAGPMDGIRMIDNPQHTTATETETARAPAASDALQLRGCRILLAEDGPDNRKLITLILERAGADMTVVENGKLAVDKVLAARTGNSESASDREYDVVLLDMQMPVMDGYQAARRLRSQGYSGPIIALTAHAMEDDRAKCIAAGCDDYTTKPIDRARLIEIVRSHLRQPTTA